MIQLKQFSVREKIAEKSEIVVYRGAAQDGRPVIIKANREGRGEPAVLARINHEFEVTRDLVSQGIITPFSLERYSEGLALIFDDYEGRSLRQYLESGPLDEGTFLDFALSLTQTLGELHARGLIHKDIKPDNILINGDGTPRIIDFGISSKLSLKRQHLGNPGVLEGTLAYISPEQTGRMNRVVDHRSDLYSLGVTFYEMLSGAPPFESQDSLELVHAHMARNPRPLNEIKADLPPSLCAVVMKLLAKDAEDRYQSASGLGHDLDLVKQGLSFTPGADDYSGRFQIPQKLYGRDAQREQLLGAF